MTELRPTPAKPAALQVATARTLAGLPLVLLFVSLAALHTFPLVLNSSTHVPGEGFGDNVSFVWNLWWMREALASGHDYFQTPFLMAPSGAPLVLHTHTALASAIGATALGGLTIVQAQNVLIIGAVALNGVCAFLLAWHVCRDRTASVLAGVLFMLAPPLTARLMGHFNLLWAWTLVLTCLAACRFVSAPTVRTAVYLGTATAVTAYADYYLFVYAAIVAAVFVLTECWAMRVAVRRWQATRGAVACAVLGVTMLGAAMWIALSGGMQSNVFGVRVSMRSPQNAATAAWIFLLASALVAWKPRVRVSRLANVSTARVGRHLALAVVVCVTLVLPLVGAALEAWSSGDYVTQESALKSGPPGVDVATAFMGPPFHGLIGHAVRERYERLRIDAMEQSAWLGVIPVLLALLAGRDAAMRHERRRWTVITLVFLVWTLGPYLIAFGANTGIILPQALARVVPLLNNARMPGRALIVVSLGLAMLAAMNMAARPALRRPAVAGALVLLAFVELAAAPLAIIRLPSFGRIEHYLAADRERGNVLHVPFGVRDGFGERGMLAHENLYLQSAYARPMAGGFVARLPKRIWTWYEDVEPFRSLLRLSAGQPSPLPSCELSVAGLRRASIRYVVVNRPAAPAAAALIDRLPLDRVASEGDRELWVLKETAHCRQR